MAEMINQVISHIIWISLATCCFAVSRTEVPKECTVGTADYNETLCNDTCTKDIHKSQPYCANLTSPTTTILSQPQQQEVPNPVTTPEDTSVPQEVMRNVDLSTPGVDPNEESSGISLEPSLIFNVSCLLLAITFSFKLNVIF